MSRKHARLSGPARRNAELAGEQLTIDQIAAMLKEDIAFEKAGHPGHLYYDRRTGHPEGHASGGHPMEHRRQTRHRGRG